MTERPKKPESDLAFMHRKHNAFLDLIDQLTEERSEEFLEDRRLPRYRLVPARLLAERGLAPKYYPRWCKKCGNHLGPAPLYQQRGADGQPYPQDVCYGCLPHHHLDCPQMLVAFGIKHMPGSGIPECQCEERLKALGKRSAPEAAAKPSWDDAFYHRLPGGAYTAFK